MFERPTDESMSFDGEGNRVDNEAVTEKGMSFDGEGNPVEGDNFNATPDTSSTLQFEQTSQEEAPTGEEPVSESQEEPSAEVYPEAPYKLRPREDVYAPQTEEQPTDTTSVSQESGGEEPNESNDVEGEHGPPPTGGVESDASQENSSGEETGEQKPEPAYAGENAQNKEGAREGEPSLREIGRERITKIGNFFNKFKESFQSNLFVAGGSMSRLLQKIRTTGVAGAEMLMAGPEVAVRAVEAGVGSVAKGYEKGTDVLRAIKNKILEAKSNLLRKGRDGIEKAVEAVVDLKKAVVEAGNHALYNFVDKITRPFIAFQSERLKSTARYMEEQVKKGKCPAEELEGVQKKLSHLAGLK
ncbi:MAG: hypothetical protein WDZ88_00010 [Candidatus Paceibacterota bacterium]